MEEGNKTKFEKDISEIFEEYGPEPPSRVWNRIEKNLDQPVGEKKYFQRTIIRWSVAASLIAGVASAAIFIRIINEKPEQQILSEAQYKNSIETVEETNSLDKTDKVRDTIQNGIQPEIKSSLKDKPLAVKSSPKQKKKIQSPEYDFQKTIEERKSQPMLASNTNSASNAKTSSATLNDSKINPLPKMEGSYSGFDQEPLIIGQTEPALFTNQINEKNEPSQNIFTNHNNAYLINMVDIAGVLANTLQNVSKTTVNNDNSTIIKYNFGIKNFKISGTKHK